LHSFFLAAVSVGDPDPHIADSESGSKSNGSRLKNYYYASQCCPLRVQKVYLPYRFRAFVFADFLMDCGQKNQGGRVMFLFYWGLFQDSN
jgi:hypothetical protein